MSLIKGSDLKIKLKRKKVKIDDIVNQYGLVRTTVSRYLNDHMAMPATFIIQVAEFTGMSIDEFIEGGTTKGQHDQDIDKSITEEENIPETPKSEVKPYPTEEEKLDRVAMKVEDSHIEYSVTPKRKSNLINTSDLEEYIFELEERIERLEKAIRK